MATLDRIDPPFTAWSPSTAGIATEDEVYVGRHRKPGMKRLSFTAMFHTGKHRAR